jgi:hypothetical protein
MTGFFFSCARKLQRSKQKRVATDFTDYTDRTAAWSRIPGITIRVIREIRGYFPTDRSRWAKSGDRSFPAFSP